MAAAKQLEMLLHTISLCKSPSLSTPLGELKSIQRAGSSRTAFANASFQPCADESKQFAYYIDAINLAVELGEVAEDNISAVLAPIKALIIQTYRKSANLLDDLDAEDDLFSSGADDGEFEFDLDLIDATVEQEVEVVTVEEPTLDTTKFGFEVYESGSGDKIKRGQTVKVDYVGTFLDGTEFDSSRSRGPFEFVAGQGNVIKCWDFAIVNLNVGDKAKLNCPSFTAYGDRGNSAVPGGATLQFDVVERPAHCDGR